MDTTVIVILIICATVIALVAIVCDHLFERKVADSSDCYMSKKIIKVHRNYIAGFLGFAVIMLITEKYGGPENAIFGYLSFGSTITSLVLSILAIFVTVQSSTDMYKQFTRIENVSIQIDNTLSVLQDAKTDLQKTSQGISDQLDNIVEQIDERFQRRIKEFAGNQLEASMDNSKDIQSVQSASEALELEMFKADFLKLTSASGLLALYACALSFEKTKMFEITNLFRKNEAYTFGYMISSLSSRIIMFTNDTTNNQISCTGSIFTSTELYEEMKERVKQFGEDYLNKINEINAYYGINALIMDVK